MYRSLLPVLTSFSMQLISPSASAEVPNEFLSTPLAAAFGAPPAIVSPRLSPDGSKLLFLRQDPVGITVVQVLDFSTGHECVRTIFPIDGIPTPLTPGDVIEYQEPDMYNRPWARTWEQHFEEGMTQPEDNDIFSFE